MSITSPLSREAAISAAGSRPGSGARGFDDVEYGLHDSKPAEPGGSTDPVGFLRRHSNYLTPRVGFLSADTWTIAAVWLRNTILNFVILAAALSALLMAPRLITGAATLSWWAEAQPWIVFFLLSAAVIFIGLNLRTISAGSARPPFYKKAAGLQTLVVLPVFIAAWLGCSALWDYTQMLTVLDAAVASRQAWSASVRIGIALTVLTVAMGTVGGFTGCYLREHHRRPYRWWQYLAGFGLGLLFAVASGAAGGAGARALMELLETWNEDSAAWNLVGWGAPVMLMLFSGVAVLHIGLMGRTFPDERREWFSRLGAWLTIYMIGWSGLYAVAIYGPWAIAWLAHATNGWAASGLSASWVATTAGGLIAARNEKTGKGDNAAAKNSPWMDAAAKLAPYVFVAGLLVFLAMGVHLTLAFLSGGVAAWPGFTWIARHHWDLLNKPGNSLTWISFGVSAAIAILLSLRVDINEFSMHHLYKNRLVRCYLGASNGDRHPDPSTGFDFHDDVKLASLAPSHREPDGRRYDGPYPIVNTALNLVHGEDLGWQERRAAAFTLTPLYCGYSVTRRVQDDAAPRSHLAADGFRPTSEYAYQDGGIGLGTAVAISGAAASPNMGYHSSAAVAFLLTVFNVRLGWWLGNPRHPRTWRLPGPRAGLAYLALELFGLANDRRNYVYLSDGGHFENLGIYELVRRRCRYIIACDAGEDRHLTFEDLGNALRKCRADLGIDITIDVERIRREEGATHSPWHCVVGTVHYERVDPDAGPGTLVYIKSSLTGDEPADVLEYAARCPDFPHQSTGDQWFNESQFESYRRLGLHASNRVFWPARKMWQDSRKAAALDIETFFLAVRQHWYPPSAAVAAAFTRHTGTLDTLCERLRSDPALRFLDAQIYPEWRELMRRAETPQNLQYWLPKTAEELRAGFYFCTSLIQLMENVYLDLNLENDHEHPDNRGWMNLFRHWSWSGMLRATWTIAAGTFGARFQSFCQRHLGLDLLDGVELHEFRPGDDPATAGLNFLEVEMISRVRAEPQFARSPAYVFRVAVRNPIASFDDSYVFRFTYGFSVVQDRRVVCFRVQDHLRRMGLGRAALKSMIEAKLVFDVLPASKLPDSLQSLWPTEERKQFDRLFDSLWSAIPPKAAGMGAGS